MAKPTKRACVLALLFDLKWHTHIEMRSEGGTRYSARLLELKRLGYRFESRGCKGKGGKEYRLMSRWTTGPKLKPKRVKVFLREKDVVRMLERDEITVHASSCLEDGLRSFRRNKEKL